MVLSVFRGVLVTAVGLALAACTPPQSSVLVPEPSKAEMPGLPAEALGDALPADLPGYGIAATLTPGGPTTIQAAINALSSSGGTVVLAPGTYDVNAPIVLPSRVALVGQTSRASDGSIQYPTLRLADGVNNHVLINKSYYNGDYAAPTLARDVEITIQNLRIEGNRTGQTQLKHGINLGYSDRSRVENVTVTNCSGSGIVFTDCTDGVIRGCASNDNGKTLATVTSGINVNDRCKRILVENNQCHRNNGFLAAAGETVYDQGPNYDGNGIRIGDHAEGNIVRNNDCRGNGRRGIKVQGAYNLVLNNTLRDNLGQSLALHGPKVIGNFIGGNFVSQEGLTSGWQAGIYLQGREGTVFANTFQRNHVVGTLYGIQAEWQASGNKFMSNLVSRTRGHGIFLRGVDDTLVQGNEIVNSGQKFFEPGGYRSNGIQLDKQVLVDGTTYKTLRTRLICNKATDTQVIKSQAYGLKTESDCNESLISGNDFSGNQWTESMVLGGSGDRIGFNSR